jgi:hypothetical protein
MTTHSDHYTHDIDYTTMLELWMGVPVFAFAGYVFGVIISQAMVLSG